MSVSVGSLTLLAAFTRTNPLFNDAVRGGIRICSNQSQDFVNRSNDIARHREVGGNGCDLPLQILQAGVGFIDQLLPLDLERVN
jgi:hypothetical protein